LFFRFKGDQEISSDDDTPHHVEVKENELVVNRFVESDAGPYTCKLLNSNNNQVLGSKSFNVIC
jgi:hypothetical protein